jgi:PAS domain S-box-containing protein
MNDLHEVSIHWTEEPLRPVPAMRKDGQRISLEFSIALLKNEHREVAGAAAVVRDVTARWQADRDLRKRLAVLEPQSVTPAPR